jgi:hypothetical protein
MLKRTVQHRNQLQHDALAEIVGIEHAPVIAERGPWLWHIPTQAVTHRLECGHE